jgi:2-aminoadipate transaminase
MKLTLENPRLVSLAAGFTDNESLPVDEAAHLLETVLNSPARARAALQYGSTIGDPRLRELTARHVQNADRGSATNYAPARTIITSGSQQLLYMTAEALCDPGDIVIVEDPTYFVYLGITQSHRIRCRGVRLQEDGIDLDQLENVLGELKRSGELPRLKMVYLVTYFQNPTGRTTTFKKKRAVLQILARYERAAGHPIYLLEDAAYRELRFVGDDERSALAAGFSERVIYAGTYSKPFASGARVGFGLMPEPVFTTVARIKGNHDFGTSNLLQQLLAGALANGVYDRHLPVLRQRYAAKAALMTKAIRRHFPASVHWDEPRGGLYVWATAPTRIKSGPKSKLFQNAFAGNVLYVPGELCYCDDSTRPRPATEMRISFGGAKDREIPTGIARLAAALRACGAK